MADVCEVESELGGLVYQSLGTVSFSHPEEAADFPVPPGYARLVAVSSRFGLTVLADHAGLCVAATARLAEVCESLKEMLPAEQIVPGDDFTRVPLRGASHVSFSPDERTLAAVAGCAVHFFQTKDLDGSRSRDGAGGASAAAAFRTQVLGDDDEAVRDLQWLAEFAGGASYLALVAKEQDTEGERAKLVVGSAMTLDQTAPVAIAEGVRAFAVARGPDDDDDVFEPEEPPAEDAASGANARGALAAWAPFGGGAVVARLTDAGYSAEMTHHPVGPCEEGAADVVVNGLAFLVGDEAPAYVRRSTFSFPVSPTEQGRLSLKRAPSSVRASPSPSVRLPSAKLRGSKPSRLAALDDTRRLLGVQGDDAARVLCPRSPKRPSRRARARSRAASRSRRSSAARGEGSAALGARHAGVRRAAADTRVSSSRADGTETKSRRATPTTRPIDAGGFRPRATPAPGARDTKREPRFAGFCNSFAAAFVFVIARRALFCVVFRVSSVSFASLVVAALAHASSPSIARAVPAAGGTSALASSSAHASPATEAKCSCRLASASRAPARRR